MATTTGRKRTKTSSTGKLTIAKMKAPAMDALVMVGGAAGGYLLEKQIAKVTGKMVQTAGLDGVLGFDVKNALAPIITLGVGVSGQILAKSPLLKTASKGVAFFGGASTVQKVLKIKVPGLSGMEGIEGLEGLEALQQLPTAITEEDLDLESEIMGTDDGYEYVDEDSQGKVEGSDDTDKNPETEEYDDIPSVEGLDGEDVEYEEYDDIPVNGLDGENEEDEDYDEYE